MARRCAVVVVACLLGCAQPPGNSAPTGAAAHALTSPSASTVPATPYLLYNPTATSTPTAAPTGVQDPTPSWIGARPAPPRSRPHAAPPPVDDAYLALQQRYVEELRVRSAEWKAQGLSASEASRLQSELKRSILGH